MNNKFSKVTLQKWMLLPIFLLGGIFAKATPSDSGPMDMSSLAQIADVNNKALTFSDFLKIQDKLPFRALSGSNEDLGFTNHHYWSQLSKTFSSKHNPSCGSAF